MSHPGSQILGEEQENQLASHGPRRFTFDFPASKIKSEPPGADESDLTDNPDLVRTIPFVANFPNPANYKESYELLVNSVLGLYNHVCLKVVENYNKELRNIIKKTPIEKPVDCLTVLKNLILDCCSEVAVSQGKGKLVSDGGALQEYEELIQKAEAKIRVFIRNEQIYRLNFDILTQKIEEADKGLQTAQYELGAAKTAYDSLIKENTDLMGKLQQKDSELRLMKKDCENIQQKYKEVKEDLIAFEKQDKTAVVEDRKKFPPQICDPNFNDIMLKENRYSPKEFIPETDRKACWNDLRQPSTRYLVTERNQHERRAHIASSSFLNTSSENSRKTERPKNSLINELKRTLDSQRTILNVSSDVGLNRSTERSQERNTINNIILGIQKRNLEQPKIGNSQDQGRVKVPIKERKQGELRDKDLASFITNRNTLQKITSVSNKYTNIQAGLSSTRRSRDGSFAIRNPLLQTEQSPDAKSQDAKASKTYIDIFHSPYAVSSRKKIIEVKEDKNQMKATLNKNSFLVKNMIAEQLSKKLNGSKYI